MTNSEFQIHFHHVRELIKLVNQFVSNATQVIYAKIGRTQRKIIFPAAPNKRLRQTGTTISRVVDH